MRKAMSYFWKIGLALLVLGLILSVTAFGLGASKGSRMFGSPVELEKTEYENIRGLEIEADIGTVEVRRGDCFSVEGSVTDQVKVRQEAEGGILSLEMKQGRDRGVWSWFGFLFNEEGEAGWGGFRLIVTVPEDVELEELEVSSGIGEVNLTDVAVTGETKIHAGTGQVKMTNFSGKGELSLDCGAGEILFQGKWEGKADIECGVGSIRMNLEGEEEDYGYRVDGGIGEIRIGSRSMGGIGLGDQSAREYADNQMDIQCGVGEIEILFEKER